MAKKIPKFSYTGAYETSSDDTYWYIKLKSSGQMTFTYRKRIEVGCVGGGGGTISNRNYAHVGGFAGGGGGYIKTGTTTAEAGTAYAVTIGAGGGGKGGRGGINAVDGGDGEDGAANTGGGAGGAGGGWHKEPYQSQPGKAGSGGSGIVIIRGTQDDYIPVIFNGTQLDRIIYNGVTLTSLIYNGTKLYCRKFRRTIKNLITANIAESRKKAEYV